MKLNRPSLESQPRPSAVPVLRARPHKAVDVLQATDSNSESGLMFDPKVDISKDSSASMFKELNERRNMAWYNSGRMSMNLSILYPDRKADLELGESEFNRMKVELDGYRGNSDWWKFGDTVTSLLILFPDRKADLKFGESEFKEMKDRLDEARRENNWPIFSGIAMNLTILAADRVDISVDGQIRLIHKKKDITKKPKPLPIVSRV